ncbi:MAG: prephenate dehydratase [Proteobacteria bacterium]|nr:prephenate dehydratase [Pseudomonadota bacterium]
MSLTVAFQGMAGAYSDLAARALFPNAQTLPCKTFEEAFVAVEQGRADRAVIPIENSTAGRVTDIHSLLPQTTLHSVGEYFLPVRHCLLAPKGARLEGVRTVASHIQALTQCQNGIAKLGLERIVAADTAGAAAAIAQNGDATSAAIASALAAEIYGLDILKSDFQDAGHNTTRFLVWSREGLVPPVNKPTKMALIFTVRNVPAALYKALGGFATNGINLLKLESYLVDGEFISARFYAELLGHPETAAVRQAMEELAFYTTDVKVLGVFEAAQN